jgi:hypothetical protein
MVVASRRAHAEAEPSSDAVGRTGLRRVEWVRLIEDGGRYRAEVVGSGFRLPVICPIPLSLASELIASGVPHVTRSAEYARAGR